MSKLPVVAKRLVKKEVDSSAVLQEAASMRFVETHSIESEPTLFRLSEDPLRTPLRDTTLPAFSISTVGLKSVANHRAQFAEDDRQRRQYGEAMARIASLEEELIRVRLAYESEQSEVARLRDELARRARDIATLNAHVDTLSQHLEASRTTDSNTFLHNQKDLVIEVESLKAKLSRAERERDASLFQLQEIERRTRMERQEESAFRDQAAARAAENERRAAYAELQRVKAEAEASSSRQQAEHWRLAAKAAQEEASALRAQLEFRGITPQASLLSAKSPPGVAKDHSSNSGAAVSAMFSGRLSDTQAASELVRRQQLAASNGTPKSSETAEAARKQAEDGIKQRLSQIANDINKIEEQMEDMGPPSQRTLAQRLQREQMRKQIDELNKEAARLKASLAPAS